MMKLVYLNKIIAFTSGSISQVLSKKESILDSMSWFQMKRRQESDE